jgi:hypothetical protein
MHGVNIKSLYVYVRVNKQDFGRNPLANLVFVLDGAEVGVRRMTLLVLILKQLIYAQNCLEDGIAWQTCDGQHRWCSLKMCSFFM